MVSFLGRIWELSLCPGRVQSNEGANLTFDTILYYVIFAKNFYGKSHISDKYGFGYVQDKT